MKKNKLNWLVFGGIFVIVTTLVFFSPYIFKKKYIEQLSKISLPDSYKIVEYKVGVNPFMGIGGIYGIDKLYAKIIIDKDTYELWKETRFGYTQALFEEVSGFKRYSKRKSMNIENVEEIFINDLAAGKYYFIAGTTGLIYNVITKESENNYYFYLLY